jgi:hypothetical protein
MEKVEQLTNDGKKYIMSTTTSSKNNDNEGGIKLNGNI